MGTGECCVRRPFACRLFYNPVGNGVVLVMGPSRALHFLPLRRLALAQLKAIEDHRKELFNLMARASEGGGGALIGTITNDATDLLAFA
jgi:hypothetical protein